MGVLNNFKFYKVAIPWLKIDSLFYKSKNEIKKGSLVEVYLKSKKLKGVVIEKVKEPSQRKGVKEIIKVVDKNFLKKEFIDFLQDVRLYYLKKWGVVLGQAVFKKVFGSYNSQYDTLTVVSSPFFHYGEVLEKIKNFKGNKFFLEMNEDFIKLLVNTIIYFMNERTIVVLFPDRFLLELYNEKIKKYINGIYEYHSFLPLKERRKVWWGVKNGNIKVVFGLRSEVFLPVQTSLLFVFVDVHDTSFIEKKREFSYDALKIAEIRSYREDVKILGFTHLLPTELRYRGEIGEIEIFIKRRKRDVSIFIEDLRKREDIILPHVEEEMKKRLEKGERIFLYINRKGYSLYLQCKDCGYTEICKRCGIALRYSKETSSLYCSSCGFRQKAWEKCPNCGSIDFLYKGIGIENVKEYVFKNFSYWNVAVVEGDSYKKLKKGLKEGFDIMIGTKGAVKHMKIKNLSLAVVVRADYDIFLPNYRAEEEAFIQYAKIAESLDISKSPFFYIQTYRPYYKMFSYLHNKIYRFYLYSLKERKILSYPPFKKMVLIKSSSISSLEKIRNDLEKNPKIDVTLPYKYGDKFCILAKVTKDIDHSAVLSNFLHSKNVVITVDPMEVV